MTSRWLPRTEAELSDALADGRLQEGPHLDFKAQLKPGKSGNAELARDVAMFANDGGALVIGVAEPESDRFELSPVDLDGLRERIEQVTRSRLDPPLLVDVTTLRSNDDAGRGYVIVRVPASASAPHMTDHRYWGRVGTTREVLSDSQVRSIVREREERLRPVLALLAEDISRDPVPVEVRRLAHLFVVARPRFAPTDLVLRAVEKHGGNWSSWILRELVAESGVRPRGTWSPDLPSQAGTVGRRARGAALFNHYVGQDRELQSLKEDPEKFARAESGLLDVEIDEDGTLHLFCGRGSDIMEGAAVTFPGIVAGLTMRVVDLAARITDVTGFIGTWDFAVGLVGARGARPYNSSHWRIGESPAYTSDDYRKATAADTIELHEHAESIGARLTGQFIRGLGLDPATIEAHVRHDGSTGINKDQA